MGKRGRSLLAVPLLSVVTAACGGDGDRLVVELDDRPVAVGGTITATVHAECEQATPPCEGNPLLIDEVEPDRGGVFEVTEIAGIQFELAAVGEGEVTVAIEATALDGSRAEGTVSLSAHDPEQVRLGIACPYPSRDPAPPQPLLIAPDTPFLADYTVTGDGVTLFGLDQPLIELAPIELTEYLQVPGAVERLSLRAPAEPTVVELTSPVDPAFTFVIDVYDVSRIDDIEIDGPAELAPPSYPAQLTWHAYPLVSGRSGCNERWPRTITSLTPAVCGFADGATELEVMSPQVDAEIRAAGTCQYEVQLPGAASPPRVYQLTAR